MSKKLFLAVLPLLALAMASCSRGNGGASSQSGSSSTSGSASGDDSSEVSSAGDTSGEQSGDDSGSDEDTSGDESSVEPETAGDYVVYGSQSGVWKNIAELTDNPSPIGGPEKMALSVTLAEGDAFKVHFEGTYWYGYDSINSDCALKTTNFQKNTDEGDSNNNIEVTVAGTYDIYIKTADGTIWINAATAA